MVGPFNAWRIGSVDIFDIAPLCFQYCRCQAERRNDLGQGAADSGGHVTPAADHHACPVPDQPGDLGGIGAQRVLPVRKVSPLKGAARALPGRCLWQGKAQDRGWCLRAGSKAELSTAE